MAYQLTLGLDNQKFQQQLSLMLLHHWFSQQVLPNQNLRSKFEEGIQQLKKVDIKQNEMIRAMIENLCLKGSIQQDVTCLDISMHIMRLCVLMYILQASSSINSNLNPHVPRKCSMTCPVNEELPYKQNGFARKYCLQTSQLQQQ